jgi:hypothetical protein
MCTWLQLRKFFDRVIPVHMYLIPGLQFMEKQLAYYEDFFQTPILRYPRESFWWILQEPQYQPPWRVISCYEKIPLPVNYGAWTLENDLRARFGVPQAWTGQGIRAFDSLTRRTAFRRTGPLHPWLRYFYPIYDWKFDRMTHELRTAQPAPGASTRTIELSRRGLRLPIDYRFTNRSFDSPRERFLRYIERLFPEDYERIKFWMPLVECERWRHRYGNQGREGDRQELLDAQADDPTEADDEGG